MKTLLLIPQVLFHSIWFLAIDAFMASGGKGRIIDPSTGSYMYSSEVESAK